MGTATAKVALVFVVINVVNGLPTNYAHNNGTEKLQSSVCHYSDPKVSECIQRVVEKAKDILAKGVPILNVQPLEPLKIPNIRLRQHNMPKNGFKYDVWLSDVTLSGLTNYSFNNLDVYPEDLKVTANISLPLLLMLGEYMVIGEFQMLPVESTGKMSSNFSGCTASLEVLGARMHKRMVIKDATVRLLCTGPVKANLTEAHSTTDEMGLTIFVLFSFILCDKVNIESDEMITQHIVGMHSADLAREIKPALETALAMVLEDIANKFLKQIPSEMVFPE